MYSGDRKTILTFLFSFLVVVITLMWVGFAAADKAAVLDDFEECAAAGNPVMESYPRRCRSANKTFTEDIGNAVEMADQIRVTIPKPNEGVAFPLEIRGEVRGNWFVDGAFPIQLIDSMGRKIAETTAHTEEELRGDNFVPFSAHLAHVSSSPARAVFVFVRGGVTDTTEPGTRLTLPVRLLGDVSTQGQSEKTTRAFTRRVALGKGDIIRFSDGLFVRLSDITDVQCLPDVRCPRVQERVAELEMSGGALGESITDVRLGIQKNSIALVREYTFELLEISEHEAVLKIPARLTAFVSRYVPSIVGL